MSDYYVTAIANGSEFPAESLGLVQAFLDKLPLKHVDMAILSKGKAVDFKVRIDLSKCDCSKDVAGLERCANEVKEAVKTHGISGIDLIFQSEENRKDKKLFVFDMDSTLIMQEVIEMIAAYADVEDKVAEITTAAMNGEIDFKESLARRVALLEGIESANLWEELKTKIQITNGAKELTKFLKAKGCKMAVCSGGFIPLARYVAGELELDYAFANTLETKINEKSVEVLSGKTIGEIVDGAKKAELLQRLSKENDIDVKYAVAVGDGANDLLMMGVAGWGVAWNAKPKVQLAAPCCLNSNSLKDILYIMGYNDLEIDEVLNK